MISVLDVLHDFGCRGFTLTDEPKTQDEFNNYFIKLPHYEGEEISWSKIQAKIIELQAAEPLRLLRLERDRILAKYDWITIRAYSQGTEVPMEWQTYLQQLRDLPATAEPQLNENGELTNVIWPTPPE
jgi:hypothetical protein